MVKAYTIINNWGYDIDYKYIKTIYDNDNNIIFKLKNNIINL